MRARCRGPTGDRAALGIDVRAVSPRLHGKGREPVAVQSRGEDVIGITKDLVQIGGGKVVFENDIAVQLIKESCGRRFHRLLRIDHRRQRIEVHLYGFGPVFSLISAVRYDRGYGLSHETNLAHRQGIRLDPGLGASLHICELWHQLVSR